MITIFIGIEGYTIPGDEYQLVLPAVSSWNIERRNKAERKNNYIGGFSTSLSKYDESKFISVSWDALPEEDINSVNGYENFSELACIVTNPVVVTTSGVNVSVNSFINIPDNTKVYVKSNNKTYTLIANNHGTGQITLKTSTGNLTLVKGDNIRLFNTSLSGLLTLASISASGQSHTLRDFMGKLVKVVFNSPKYDAIAGSDLQGQMYLSCRMDIDIIVDTMSYAYKTTQQIKGSTYNEKLPITSSILATPGSANVTALYMKNDTKIGILSKSDALTYNLEALVDFKPKLTTIGDLPTNITKGIFIFKDFISKENQINKETKVNGVTTYTDPNPEISVNFSALPDIVYIGNYKGGIDYGKWSIIDTALGYVVPAGNIITDKATNKLYLSLVDENSKVFTDKTAWLEVTNKTVVVTHFDKIYKIVKPSKDIAPDKKDNTEWAAIELPTVTIQLTFSTSLYDKLKDGLFIAVAPMLFESNTTPPILFKDSTMIKIPLLDKSFTHSVDLSPSDSNIKVASTVFTRTNVELSAIDNTVKIPLPTALNYLSQANYRINGVYVNANTTLTASTNSNMFDIDTINDTKETKLITYTVVNKDPGINNIGCGTLLMSLSSGTVTMHLSSNSTGTSIKRVYNSYTTTTASNPYIITGFTSIDTSKVIYEIVYNNKNKQVVVNVYSLSLDDNYRSVAIAGGKIDYDNTGFKVIKTKKTYTFTNFTDTPTTNQDINLIMNSVGSSYSDSYTYATTALPGSLITKLFGLEGDVWA